MRHVKISDFKGISQKKSTDAIIVETSLIAC